MPFIPRHLGFREQSRRLAGHGEHDHRQLGKRDLARGKAGGAARAIEFHGSAATADGTVQRTVPLACLRASRKSSIRTTGMDEDRPSARARSEAVPLLHP
jgi:hypothetical protein